MKEVSKVKQGCLAREETKAVEVDLDMSTALSRASLLIGHGTSQGETRFSKAALQEKDTLTYSA
jgi:hypothetical protein